VHALRVIEIVVERRDLHVGALVIDEDDIDRNGRRAGRRYGATRLHPGRHGIAVDYHLDGILGARSARKQQGGHHNRRNKDHADGKAAEPNPLRSVHEATSGMLADFFASARHPCVAT
jgi:hypothetical protein